MSEITEKKNFKIPPCTLDTELFKNIGKLLETNSSKLYNYQRQATLDVLEDVPEQYRERIANYVTDSDKDSYLPKFSLTSPSKDIVSYDVDNFIKPKWPSTTEKMAITMGSTLSPLDVKIDFNLDNSEMEKSRASISGQDGTLVHGLGEQISMLFEEKKLWYRHISQYWQIRAIISTLILVLFLVSLGLFIPQIWQVNLGLLFLIFIVGIAFLDAPLKWLFPYFEFGENPKPKKFRKVILGLITGSGLISGIVMRGIEEILKILNS